MKAAADAPTAAARRLGARNRLAETEGELEVAREKRNTQRRIAEEARAEVERSDQRERQAREALKLARKREAECRDAVGKVEKILAQLNTRLAAVTEADQRLAQSIEETQALAEDTNEELATLPPATGLLERLTLQRAAVQSDRATMTEARSALQSVVREAEMRQRRRDAIGRERQGWTERAANSASQLRILDDRREEAEIEREGLIDRPDEIAESRRALLSSIGAAESARNEAADALARAERRQAELDLAARAGLERLSSAREAKARAEERYSALKSRREELEAQIEEHFQVSAPGLKALMDKPDINSIEEIDALDRRLERLKLDRDRLGAVNLRAEDEVTEVSTKRDSLVGERDDLIEAIKRLRQGIHNLNAEARGRCSLRSRRSTSISAPSSRPFSAAAPPSCSSSNRTIRLRPDLRSTPARRAKSPRR